MTPFGRFSLCLWYGVTRPSRTIMDSIRLGVLFLRERSFLRDLIMCGQLTMLPPYLVWWEVEEISSKTVFQNILYPHQGWFLGMYFS